MRVEQARRRGWPSIPPRPRPPVEHVRRLRVALQLILVDPVVGPERHGPGPDLVQGHGIVQRATLHHVHRVDGVPDVLERVRVEHHQIGQLAVTADVFGRQAALSMAILYGGSVEPENARALMQSGVSGFLVGHASVEPKSLLEIARAASTRAKK